MIKDIGTIPAVPRPTGEQFEIVKDGATLTITEVGATLRSFVVDGRSIVWGFGADEMSTAGRGQVLAPWPNRLDAGTYTFNGVTAHAALDEPELDNAIHGLVRWLKWTVAPIDVTSVSCVTYIAPQPGYPWWLRLEVVYSVGARSLCVKTTATNIGDVEAPFALGFHPYLSPGSGGLDAARLALRARRRLVFDARKLPVASEEVSRSELDGLERGVALRGLHLDEAFTDIEVDAGGRWQARFIPRGASPVVVWADQVFTHVMCFTADSLFGSDNRAAIAIEPMTAAPNALATGEGVISLAPGASFVASWGIDA